MRFYAFFAINRVFDSRMALRLSGLRLLITPSCEYKKPSLRAKRSNPAFFCCTHFLDCFASLAMTQIFSLRSMRFYAFFAVKWFLLGFPPRFARG